MAAEVESMMSVREVPWHGLGVVVNDYVPTAEAIRLAGLDWEVEKQTVYRGNQRLEVPNKFANVRTSDDKFFGMVGPDFKNLQNRDAFTFADALIDSGDAKVETAGALRGGRVVFITMKLPQEIRVAGEDAHNMYLLFRMGHDGTMSIAAEVVMIRVVCMNTLNMAIKSARRRWSITHRQDINGRLAEAREALQLSYEYADAFTREAEALLDVDVTQDQFRIMLEDILPNRPRTDEVITAIADTFWDTPTNGYTGTGWGAMNSLTEYLDHGRETRSQEAVFNNIMNGEIARLRNDLRERILVG